MAAAVLSPEKTIAKNDKDGTNKYKTEEDNDDDDDNGNNDTNNVMNVIMESIILPIRDLIGRE